MENGRTIHPVIYQTAGQLLPRGSVCRLPTLLKQGDLPGEPGKDIVIIVSHRPGQPAQGLEILVVQQQLLLLVRLNHRPMLGG
jgi:hypothetical protein